MVRFCIALVVSSIASRVFAQTSSPFAPPKETLGTYVVNSGAGLDTGCTFRSSGPLIVNIIVPATMNENELNSDGTLKNPNKLISSTVIGATARVRFPVFDIDSDASVVEIAPEIDRLTFNRQFKKNLSGVNNQWTDDSLTVPISEIRFRSSKSSAAINELRVDIDQGNIGRSESWCMAIDWVAVEFDAAAPVTLLHGINADEKTWDESNSPGVQRNLTNAGVLWRRFTSGRNERSLTNALDLTTRLKGFSTR